MLNNHLEGGTRSRAEAPLALPLVSVIVVVYKDSTELLALIDNLASFRGPNLEVVIIDGGSPDNTPEILQQNSDRIDYWLSEPDKGIYDAMNKGLKASRGVWIIHINAGDRLTSVPFDLLRSLGSEIDILCCRVQCEELLFIPRTNWSSRYQNTWQHQGTFYRRQKHDGYDTTYRVLGDFAANQRMLSQGMQAAISTDIVSTHLNGGASSQPNILNEEIRSIRENFGRTHQLIHSFLFRPARRAYRNVSYWIADLKKTSGSHIKS
jgi:hypothetical protein